MRVRLAVAAVVNIDFINVQGNMAAGALKINMCVLFTNCKLLAVHSESIPRSRSKTAHSATPRKHFLVEALSFLITFVHYIEKIRLKTKL